MTYDMETMIACQEKNKHDLSFVLREYITHTTIDSLSPERIFVGFMDGIDLLLISDMEDYYNNGTVRCEWMIRECWERMHPLYKEQVLAAFPYIQTCIEFNTYSILFEKCFEFHDFNFNTFKRVTLLERAEIIKRAQTKLLKEEIVMEAMHPDRLEKRIEMYGIEDVMNVF